jgi:hypothetical protein
MPRIAFAALLSALVASVLSLGACQKRIEPPGDPGVCYHVAFKGDQLVYRKLVNTPNLETCAANLEAMRIKFLRLGGSAEEILGAYQANFLFIQRAGIFSSTSLSGPRYLALVRTGDGRLAIPGAMPQAPQQ